MPTPMPLARPTSAATPSASGMAKTVSMKDTWVAMTKAVIVATTPTERSMPPVSMVSVWAAARMASGMANLDDVADPALVDDARLEELQEQHEPEQEEDERDHRAVAEHPAHVDHLSPGALARGLREPGHDRRLRRATRAPTRTTATMMRPSMTWATLGSIDIKRQVLARQSQDEDGHDGTDQPTPAASEADTAEHDCGHAGQQVRTLDGGADAGVHGQDEPAHGGEEPGQRVGRDLGAIDRDAAAEGRQAVRSDRVHRQTQTRSPERDPDHAQAHDEQQQCLGQPVADLGRHDEAPDGADDELTQPHRGRAAGCVQHHQRGAFPDEEERQRDHDIGHAREHDGEAVDGAQAESHQAG